MPVRKRKPTSPGRRFQSASDFAEVRVDPRWGKWRVNADGTSAVVAPGAKTS